MKWAKKKVLVTGAGGFIGSHLTELLVKKGAEVSCLLQYNSMNSWEWIDTFPESTLKKLTILTGDLRDSDCVRRSVKGQSVVFHLGALIPIPYSYLNPRDVVDTNVLGTLNVLQACRDAGVERMVHTSTSETYGTARTVPIKEDHPLQAQSPYAASKIAADKLAESFFLSYGLPVVTVRPFNTYGPRQSARAVIPAIITQLLRGKELRMGNLSPTRDLTYVTDTAEGFMKVAERGKDGEVVNLGAMEEISMGELAEKIMGIMKVRGSIRKDSERVRPSGSEVERLVADSSKARKLGWRPKVALDEGLRRTIEWLRAHQERYKPEIYNV